MTLHRFEPTSFHLTFGPHLPALRIRSMDTVQTITLDCYGRDAEDRVLAGTGNPMTGPFYVDEAKVGTTLCVRLDALTPNRTFGRARTALAERVLEPEHVLSMPRHEITPGVDPERLRWAIDSADDTVSLEQPDGRLGSLTLPLEPMVGCLGVAPDDGQTLNAAGSGPSGGNMDLRLCRAGTTLRFPVFVEGALLLLGDGHARQGDGEIVGSGVETSMDVTFSVWVEPSAIEWPRGEDAETIFTIGNARPLDEALQHATSEMVRLLATDFGLDGRAASILMGQAAEYRIGNVYNPQYTVACLLAKAVLPGEAITVSRPSS